MPTTPDPSASPTATPYALAVLALPLVAAALRKIWRATGRALDRPRLLEARRADRAEEALRLARAEFSAALAEAEARTLEEQTRTRAEQKDHLRTYLTLVKLSAQVGRQLGSSSPPPTISSSSTSTPRKATRG